MKAKIVRMNGEDIRAGQFVSYPDGVYRVLYNDRDQRGGGGIFQLMGRDKRTWTRDYKGIEKIKTLIVGPK